MSVKGGQSRVIETTVGSPHTPICPDTGLGLQAIYRACIRIYPNQLSPLQVTALRKFWMGGPDPLDYIYMFSNQGSADAHSPPHWHYVTNGLSDLYGDARLHNQTTSCEGPSGFGFELTFRLHRREGEKSPPTWPAHLLQSLARYVFRSQAQLLPGDHIPWHCALDQLPSGAASGSQASASSPGQPREEAAMRQSIAMAAVAAAASLIASPPLDQNSYSSAVAAAVNAATAEYQRHKRQPPPSSIRHMLIVEDSQLASINTPHGWVHFLQIVGLCDEELRLVQRWTGSQVADILRQYPATGGALLVTDMFRKANVFDIQPGLSSSINERMTREGSNLSGVTTQFFSWAAIDPFRMSDLLPGEREAVAVVHKRLGPRDGAPESSFSNSDSCKTHHSSEKPRVHSDQESYQPSGSTVSTAMETDDSGSVATLSQTPAKTKRLSIMADEQIVDGATARQPVKETVQTNSNPQKEFSSPSADARTSDTENKSKSSAKADTEMLCLTDDRPSQFSETCSMKSTAHLPQQLISDFTPRQKITDESNSAPNRFCNWSDRISFADKTSNPLSLKISQKNALSAFGSDIPKSCDSTVHEPMVTESSECGRHIGFASGALGFTVSERHRCSVAYQSSENLPTPSIHPYLTPFALASGINSPESSTPGSVGSAASLRSSGGGGGGGGESAPCTPLAHLSLSPGLLEHLPSRIIEWLDVQLSLEAGEMLPLAIGDRLKHGRHFTFLNAHSPEHAITLVPPGVTGAMVSAELPYVSRGPWLQIYLAGDFLKQLESQFACLRHPEDIALPLVFRWPERRLRICLLDAGTPCLPPDYFPAQNAASSSSSKNGSPFFPVNTQAPFASSHPALQKAVSPADHPQMPFSPGFSLSPTTGFPRFPPGCIPPPSVIAALITAASSFHQQQQQPDRKKVDPGPHETTKAYSTSPPSSHPKPNAFLDYLFHSFQQQMHATSRNASTPAAFLSPPHPYQLDSGVGSRSPSNRSFGAGTNVPGMMEAMQAMMASLGNFYSPTKFSSADS